MGGFWKAGAQPVLEPSARRTRDPAGRTPYGQFSTFYVCFCGIHTIR